MTMIAGSATSPFSVDVLLRDGDSLRIRALQPDDLERLGPARLAKGHDLALLAIHGAVELRDRGGRTASLPGRLY